jgi:hypothetical protein
MINLNFSKMTKEVHKFIATARHSLRNYGMISAAHFRLFQSLSQQGKCLFLEAFANSDHPSEEMLRYLNEFLTYITFEMIWQKYFTLEALGELRNLNVESRMFLAATLGIPTANVEIRALIGNLQELETIPMIPGQEEALSYNSRVTMNTRDLRQMANLVYLEFINFHHLTLLTTLTLAEMTHEELLVISQRIIGMIKRMPGQIELTRKICLSFNSLFRIFIY